MRLVIDRQLCAGHAQCVLAAPHLVELGPDDKSALIDGADPADHPEEARDAELLCPELAISLVE